MLNVRVILTDARTTYERLTCGVVTLDYAGAFGPVRVGHVVARGPVCYEGDRRWIAVVVIAVEDQHDRRCAALAKDWHCVAARRRTVIRTPMQFGNEIRSAALQPHDDVVEDELLERSSLVLNKPFDVAAMHRC